MTIEIGEVLGTCVGAEALGDRLMAWFDWDSEKETLEECRVRRLMQMPALSPIQLEVLEQMTHAVWDGYVISKTARGDLYEMGLITRWNGWQIITREGLMVLETLGKLPTKYSSKEG